MATVKYQFQENDGNWVTVHTGDVNTDQHIKIGMDNLAKAAGAGKRIRAVDENGNILDIR